MKTSNNALLGTLHKVSGPQNADVRHNHMKTLIPIIFLLVCTPAFAASKATPPSIPNRLRDTIIPACAFHNGRAVDILEFMVSTALYDPLSPTFTLGHEETFYNDFPAVLDHSLYAITNLPPMTFMMRNMRLQDALDLVTSNYHLTYRVTETNILIFSVDGILLNRKEVEQGGAGYPPQSVGSPDP